MHLIKWQTIFRGESTKPMGDWGSLTSLVELLGLHVWTPIRSSSFFFRNNGGASPACAHLDYSTGYFLPPTGTGSGLLYPPRLRKIRRNHLVFFFFPPLGWDLNLIPHGSLHFIDQATLWNIVINSCKMGDTEGYRQQPWRMIWKTEWNSKAACIG